MSSVPGTLTPCLAHSGLPMAGGRDTQSTLPVLSPRCCLSAQPPAQVLQWPEGSITPFPATCQAPHCPVNRVPGPQQPLPRGARPGPLDMCSSSSSLSPYLSVVSPAVLLLLPPPAQPPPQESRHLDTLTGAIPTA